MKKDISDFNRYTNVDIQSLKEPFTINQDMSEGYINQTIYPVLPGIFLVLNDVHTSVVPAANGEFYNGSKFLLNYCLDGRCEFHLSDVTYSYVKKNMSSIGTEMVSDFFYYPSAYYLGYEIYAYPTCFTEETYRILNLFSIDVDFLINHYKSAGTYFTPKALTDIWNELYQIRNQCDAGHIRLMTLGVLSYLCEYRNLPAYRNLYLTKTQSNIAKRAKEIFTEDLSRHISIKAVAASLGVGETSLKNYFQSVYGMNISTFLNDARMRLAARLLTDSDMSISDIAKSCGYVNQGRFAKIFYGYSHMKPLEYRRNGRIKEK